MRDDQSRGQNAAAPGEKEPFMLEILDNLADVFYIVDHEWRVRFINRKAEQCWYCRREDLLGRVFWECFPKVKDREKHEIAMSQRIPVQYEAPSPDGALWADIRVYPIQNGGLAVFFRDISDKKRAEELLRLSQDRQTIMLRLSDSLRPLTNPDDIQETAARIVGEFLGVEKAFFCDVVTVDGVQYFSLENLYSVAEPNRAGLHPINSPGVLAEENYEGRNIIVCDMETDTRIEESQRPALRELRLGAWVSVPLMRNGRFVASFTVIQPGPRDWTLEEISLIEETTSRTWAELDRVRAEEALRKSEQHALRLVSELEEADRNKNDFINSLSHELRNPLASLVACLSMLDILDQNPTTRKPKEIMRRQTEQLCHLVDDLLDLTRITNNKIQLNMETIDLNGLAQSCVYDHRKLFEDKGVELETDICPDPLYISADPVRMSQVIGNLLHNAYKFTDKGGKATLTTLLQDGCAAVVIRDNGIGIEQAFLSDIFKTFRQAGLNKGGLGLGLSIVKGMVELHGGSVTAESGGLDLGAEFTVRLPLAEKPSAVPPAAPQAAEYSDKQLRILLIDDNRDLVETSSALLGLYGYKVASAYSGKGGIEKAREFLPHVILCDIGLPDINGYEVAREISGCRELKGSRLISLSGYAQASDIEDSMAAGFDLHISKPVDFDNLKLILDSITP